MDWITQDNKNYGRLGLPLREPRATYIWDFCLIGWFFPLDFLNGNCAQACNIFVALGILHRSYYNTARAQKRGQYVQCV